MGEISSSFKLFSPCERRKKCLISFFFLFSFIHIFSFIHLVSAVVWKTVECVVYFVGEWWCFFVWSESLTIYETIFQPILRATREIQSRDIELFEKEIQFDANLPQSFLFSSCNGHVVLGEWKQNRKKVMLIIDIYKRIISMLLLKSIQCCHGVSSVQILYQMKVFCLCFNVFPMRPMRHKHSRSEHQCN